MAEGHNLYAKLSGCMNEGVSKSKIRFSELTLNMIQCKLSIFQNYFLTFDQIESYKADQTKIYTIKVYWKMPDSYFWIDWSELSKLLSSMISFQRLKSLLMNAKKSNNHLKIPLFAFLFPKYWEVNIYCNLGILHDILFGITRSS